MSEEGECGLFVYRIYEGYHINLRECSMYGNLFFLPGLHNKTHIQC